MPRLSKFSSIGMIAVGLLASGFVATPAVADTSEATNYSWGRNSLGQLGDGTTSSKLTPEDFASDVSFTSVALGTEHACGLTASGSAYCWGRNMEGQLGDGTTTQRLTPTPVVGPSGGPALTFTSLTAAFHQTCGLADTGVSYCWGYNGYGQLGDGTTTDKSTPTVVSGGNSFVSLAAGGTHTCGLTASGSASCWGEGRFGALGDNTASDRSSPTAVVGPGGGTALNFAFLTAGSSNTCGLVAGGEAYCWGTNYSGEIGDGSTTQRNAPVAVGGPSGGSALEFTTLTIGAQNVCGLTDTGQAYCWGNNFYGQLGDGTTSNNPYPVATVGPGGGAALTFTSLSAGGSNNVCGLTGGGSSYCWGRNNFGQFGDGTTSDSSTPTPVSTDVRFSIIAAGGNGFTVGLVALGSSASTSRPRYEFTFWLESGEQCTDISPQTVQRGEAFTLPGALAGCRREGTEIVGWTVPWGDRVYPPGTVVTAVDSQQFTAVLKEPAVTVLYDANVAAADGCWADGVEVASDDRVDSDELMRDALVGWPLRSSAPCTPYEVELQGWNTRGDGSGESFGPGSLVPAAWAEADENRRHLYAVWGR